jgi:hypothetical protein
MDDALRMGGVECVGDIDGDFEEAIEREKAGTEERFEIRAFEILHDDVEEAVLRADFVDGADVGVIERGGGAGFAAKTFKGLRILGGFAGEKFEGDEAAELDVFGFVDDAHASATNAFEDAVTGQGSAKERIDLGHSATC